MSTLHQSYRYPVHWGTKVTGLVTERYARGTYNLAQLLDTSPGIIRWWMTKAICQGYDLKFRTYKNCIKTLEDYSIQDLRRLERVGGQMLHKWIVFLSADDALDEY